MPHTLYTPRVGERGGNNLFSYIPSLECSSSWGTLGEGIERHHRSLRRYPSSPRSRPKIARPSRTPSSPPPNMPIPMKPDQYYTRHPKKNTQYDPPAMYKSPSSTFLASSPPSKAKQPVSPTHSGSEHILARYKELAEVLDGMEHPSRLPHQKEEQFSPIAHQQTDVSVQTIRKNLPHQTTTTQTHTHTHFQAHTPPQLQHGAQAIPPTPPPADTAFGPVPMANTTFPPHSPNQTVTISAMPPTTYPYQAANQNTAQRPPSGNTLDDGGSSSAGLATVEEGTFTMPNMKMPPVLAHNTNFPSLEEIDISGNSGSYKLTRLSAALALANSQRDMGCPPEHSLIDVSAPQIDLTPYWFLFDDANPENPIITPAISPRDFTSSYQIHNSASNTTLNIPKKMLKRRHSSSAVDITQQGIPDPDWSDGPSYEDYKNLLQIAPQQHRRHSMPAAAPPTHHSHDVPPPTDFHQEQSGTNTRKKKHHRQQRFHTEQTVDGYQAYSASPDSDYYRYQQQQQGAITYHDEQQTNINLHMRIATGQAADVSVNESAMANPHIPRSDTYSYGTPPDVVQLVRTTGSPYRNRRSPINNSPLRRLTAQTPDAWNSNVVSVVGTPIQMSRRDSPTTPTTTTGTSSGHYPTPATLYSTPPLHRSSKGSSGAGTLRRSHGDYSPGRYRPTAEEINIPQSAHPTSAYPTVGFDGSVPPSAGDSSHSVMIVKGDQGDEYQVTPSTIFQPRQDEAQQQQTEMEQANVSVFADAHQLAMLEQQQVYMYGDQEWEEGNLPPWHEPPTGISSQDTIESSSVAQSSRSSINQPTNGEVPPPSPAIDVDTQVTQTVELVPPFPHHCLPPGWSSSHGTMRTVPPLPGPSGGTVAIEDRPAWNSGRQLDKKLKETIYLSGPNWHDWKMSEQRARSASLCGVSDLGSYKSTRCFKKRGNRED